MSIEVGDLVMVVNPMPCCQSIDDIGRVYRVEEIVELDTPCNSCGSEALFACAGDGSDYDLIPLECLKKIDPPSTGELTGVPLRLKEPV